MFIVETITGVLLALYYIPHSSQAYASVQNITHIVPYGFFIRNIHYWAGQIMVVLVLLHMIRVFVAGAYASPRHFNWLMGVGLLVATVLVDFTGYLIIWDDRALWAWTIARNLMETVPIVGHYSASLALGPDGVTDYTLVKLYAWHVLFIPGLMVVLMAWHFWRIRADGGISVPL
jgi:quinol-cytochrome oxidoreductase complex cytochrome b subunit